VNNPYGWIITLSIFVGLIFSVYLAKKESKNTNVIWDGIFWVILPGILGARLYHVIDLLNYYSKFPAEIFYIWQGGLGIIGAILGGLAGLFFYLKLRKLNIIYWVDLVIISLPISQAVGRLGNFFNKENFGTPTTLPWGQYISKDKRPVEFLNHDYFHPAYFYEAILNLLLFIVLYYLYKSKKVDIGSGSFFYIYLLGYSAIRFGLEFIRINTFRIGSLNVAQVISILVILISSYKLLKR
jgi:phosphatidylglycerol:prolipoprotein diacylglycerol transferase